MIKKRKATCGKCGKQGHYRTTCKANVAQKKSDYPADFRVFVRYKSKTKKGSDWESDRVHDIVKSGGGNGGPFVGTQIRNGQRQVQFIYETKKQADAAVKRIRAKTKKLRLKATTSVFTGRLPSFWSSWRRKSKRKIRRCRKTKRKIRRCRKH